MENQLNIWDRLGTNWAEINQTDLDLLKEMALKKLKTEEMKLQKKLQFSYDSVKDLDKLNLLKYRVDFLKRIINTPEILKPQNNSNYQ
jgi:hypothetical protein